jgi:lipopolysaccharide transport protein LptA
MMLHEHAARPAMFLAALVFCTVGWAGSLRAQPSSSGPVAPKTALSIAVAPFERVGEVDSDVPDVAMMLARRLSTLGVERVVSPRELGVPPIGDPDAETAAEWAKRSDVQTVVVGRTTALGSKLSVDARLRSGASGSPLGRRFFVEVSRPRDLAIAVEELAGQVLAQAGEAELPATPVAGAAPAPAESDAAPAGAAPAGEAPAGGPPAVAAAAPPRAGFRKDAPISIHSDMLDVFDKGGAKRFVFTGGVTALQAGLEIRCQRLEAHYPPGRSQPARIVATGSVKMKQEGRVAICEEAIFYRDDDRIVCIGNVAEVEQGCDLVRGREITFHTATEELKVKGAADVRINPDSQCATAPGTGQ